MSASSHPAAHDRHESTATMKRSLRTRLLTAALPALFAATALAGCTVAGDTATDTASTDAASASGTAAEVRAANDTATVLTRMNSTHRMPSP